MWETEVESQVKFKNFLYCICNYIKLGILSVLNIRFCMNIYSTSVAFADAAVTDIYGYTLSILIYIEFVSVNKKQHFVFFSRRCV